LPGTVRRDAAKEMALLKFLKWWWSELAALIPGAGRSVHARASVLEFVVDERQVAVRHRVRGVTRELGRMDRESPSPSGASVAEGGSGIIGDHSSSDALMATLQGLRASLDHCEVHVAPDLALRRQVLLPTAAEENLREVLGYDMERQTPFRSEDVYYDYRVVERDAATGQLRVDLVFARRGIVDEALSLLGDWPIEQMTEDAGLGAGEGTDDSGRVILTFAPAGRGRRRGYAMAPSLLLVNGVLLVCVLGWPVLDQRKQLNALRAELTATRRAAVQAGALQDDIAALLASRSYVASQRSARPATVLVLEELTQRIPDDTYLTRLEIKDGNVRLQGSSLTASALIAILEDSPYLSTVRFASPVVRQGNDSRERFHLAATLSVPDEQTVRPGDGS